MVFSGFSTLLETSNQFYLIFIPHLKDSKSFQESSPIDSHQTCRPNHMQSSPPSLAPHSEKGEPSLGLTTPHTQEPLSPTSSCPPVSSTSSSLLALPAFQQAHVSSNQKPRQNPSLTPTSHTTSSLSLSRLSQQCVLKQVCTHHLHFLSSHSLPPTSYDLVLAPSPRLSHPALTKHTSVSFTIKPSGGSPSLCREPFPRVHRLPPVPRPIPQIPCMGCLPSMAPNGGAIDDCQSCDLAPGPQVGMRSRWGHSSFLPHII